MTAEPSTDTVTVSPPSPDGEPGWLASLRSWRRLLHLAWGVPGIVLLLLAVWIMPWSPRHWFDGWFPGEPGKIIVDSPEVYTRERLINDRLEEHLWLNAQLKQATTTESIFDGYFSSANRFVLTDRADHEAGQASPPAAGEHGRTIAFDEEFRLRSAVRDQIRQRILENQLDDRHDLFGNSLYILKFDATIVPSSRPGERAYVRVSVDIPEMYEDLKQNASSSGAADSGGLAPHVVSYFEQKGANLSTWISLFEHWRADLTGRLNDGVGKEYEGFFGNRWAPEEYDELRRFLRNKIAAADGAPAELLAKLDIEAASFARIEALYDLARRLESDPAWTPGASATGKGARWGASVVATGIGEYIGARTVRLVLGVQLASTPNGLEGVSSVGDRLLFKIGSLAPYVDLHLMNSSELRAAPDFSVTEHQDQFYVVDDNCVRNTSAEKSETSFSVFDRWTGRSDSRVVYFNKTSGLPQYRVTEELFDVMKRADSVYEMSPKYLPQFPQVAECGSVDVLALRSGLFSFIDRIAQADLYSYAVLPRQSVRATVSEILNRVEINGGVFQGTDEQARGVGMNARVDESRSGAMLRSVVTSFGSMEGHGSEPRNNTSFGWIVDPSRGMMSTDDAAPQPITDSMVAIVSVPAWWDELNLSIETGWIDGAGKWTADTQVLRGRPAPTDADAVAAESIGGSRDVDQSDRGEPFKVVLPNSYEGIDALLLQIKRRKPVIVEADFEQTALTACTSASILIRGNRLWRNSVVTLGSQEAAEIKVMPNMEGILARFETIEIPNHVTDAGGQETLRVWTSEGMAELRQKISIGIPSSISSADKELRRCPASLADQSLGRTAKAD